MIGLSFGVVDTLPSEKVTSSRLTPDWIRANNAARRCCGVGGCSRRLQLCASIRCRSSSVRQLISETEGSPSISESGSGGSGISWRFSSSDDGGSTGVVVPEVLTPVTEELLLGVQTIKSSSMVWYRLGHWYPNTILDSSIWCSGFNASVRLLKKIPIAKLLKASADWCAEIVMLNVINSPSSIWKKWRIQWGMGMVNSQVRVIGVGSLDRFCKTILLCEAMLEQMYLVRSDKRGAHNLLKPEYCI